MLRGLNREASHTYTMQVEAEINPVNTTVERDATRVHIRGSSLLLGGQCLSLGINFAAQVLVVRYFSTGDYGALAFGLGIVGLFQIVAVLGLNEAVARFVPIYHQNREYEKLVGTILLATGAVILSGVIIILAVYGPLSHFLTQEKLALRLLTILIFLVPIEAADTLLDALFASFAGTRDIFFRKYMLGPGLKFGVVLFLIWKNSTITFLAYGYLLASAVGVLTYIWMLLRLLEDQGLLRQLKSLTIQVPTSEILSFVLPGLSSTLATAAIASINIFLLGHLRSMPDVAYYRAVVPAAQLNGVVMASFTLMYIPSAARLFAKSDYAGFNKLYWQTAAWMSVVSFPIFAVTFSLSRPLTVLLFGARYEQSGSILALLSLASYFNTALGFNLQTLKVLGRLRYIIVMSALGVLIDVVVSMFLIVRYGAIGAGIGTAVALISYNLLMQVGLLPTPNFKAFDRRYFSIYLTIALGASGLLVIQSLMSLSLYVALPLVVCISMMVLTVAKKKLNILETFPELLSLPFTRLLLT
ncbi:MAG TPA: flippase [Verrucomicrobiae bacterium]|nr:flippase [Verrucomicrobiae bacterium]